MSSSAYRSLVRRARDARRAPTPHSHDSGSEPPPLARNGKVYTGCNIENSSYGLTICAERTALFKAVSEGGKNFVAMAVVSDDGGFTPCGACRQVILDLAGDIDVVLADSKGRMRIQKLHELLPYPFTAADLLKCRRN